MKKKKEYGREGGRKENREINLWDFHFLGYHGWYKRDKEKETFKLMWLTFY